MQARTIVTWQAEEFEFVPKARSWYWAIGILAAGIAIAAVVLSDYLFAVIALVGGFSIMLVGSAQPRRHTYRLTEKGFMIGSRLIPYENMKRFAIHENPHSIAIETDMLSGTLHAPLANADYRAIEMELKNRNVEEVDSLNTFSDHLAKRIGI